MDINRPQFRFAFGLLLTALLCSLSLAADAPSARDSAIVQTLLRLRNMDVNSKPKWRDAVLRYLKPLEGTERYVELVTRLNLRGVEEQLLQMALANPDSNIGVKAATLLVSRENLDRFQQLLNQDNTAKATQAVTVLGFVGLKRTDEFLQRLVTDPQQARGLRTIAASGVARTISGQRFLLELVEKGDLPNELQFTVANALFASPDSSIRERARALLSLPAGIDSAPMPPVSELVERLGDAPRGAQLFRTTANCSKCHKIGEEGKEVGPDLSEIGSKLTPEALFISILDPSAGISHNYETFTAILNDGNIVSGLQVSRTASSVTLRTAEAIDKSIAMDDIEEISKNQTSLMPNDLQKTMTVQDLVDVVGFLAALKRAGSAVAIPATE